MSRPHKNPKTGIFYFRQKTPADLRQAFGKAEASWSLRTKNEDAAKLLHVEAFQQQAMTWKSLRAKPEPIPHKHLMALVGAYRRELDTMVEDEPGEPSLWVAMLCKTPLGQL